jgi:large subunit ribosomal protein L9
MRPHASRFTFYITDFAMAKTEVILTHNIVGLGAESDQVKVAAGYARNFLFPQGLAVPVTAANKRRLEVLRQRRAEREAHELNTMTELAKSVSKLICLLTVKTGEDGKMFGTITAGMIADQLKTQFDISLDKRKIHLETPIRALGDHDVELRLHSDVATTLKVRVESTTPLPTPVEVAAAEGRKGDVKTEKRGRRPDAGAKGETAEKDDKGEKAAGERKARPAKADKAAKTEKAPKVEKPE